jgi:hypothetical protein
MFLPDKLGVNIDAGNIINDTSDLQLGVLEDVAEEGGFACKQQEENISWFKMKILNC